MSDYLAFLLGSVAAGLMFGLWQESTPAGLFMFTACLICDAIVERASGGTGE